MSNYIPSTHELAGAALDWAVAKANGEKLVEVEGKHSVITGFRLNPIRVPGGYTPSTDWNQGGSLILGRIEKTEIFVR